MMVQLFISTKPLLPTLMKMATHSSSTEQSSTTLVLELMMMMMKAM